MAKSLTEQAMEEFFLTKPKYHPITHEQMGYILPTQAELEEMIKQSKSNGLVKKRARELLPELCCKIIMAVKDDERIVSHAGGKHGS